MPSEALNAPTFGAALNVTGAAQQWLQVMGLLQEARESYKRIRACLCFDTSRTGSIRVEKLLLGVAI